MIVNDLWDIWNRVFHKDIHRIQLHSNLQREIKQLAEKNNYYGRLEYPTPHELRKGRTGLVDVVWLNPYAKQPEIAFEIDSGRRARSIKKLLDMDVTERYWLYYGRFENIASYVEKYDKEHEITLVKFPYYKTGSTSYNEAQKIVKIKYANKKSKKEKRKPLPNSIKNETLVRQYYRCAFCGELLPAIKHFHHKVHIADGGESTLDNLIALCPKCHNEFHHREQVEANQRKRFSPGEDMFLKKKVL